MKAYEHSRSFDLFKTVEERIKSNYTTEQYLSTLDNFLWQSLVPIHTECPSLFNNYVAKVVAHQALRPSTKFTSLTAEERGKLPVHLFNMLTAADVPQAHNAAKAMYLNRGLLFGFLALFHNMMRPYMKLHSAFYDIDTLVRAHRMRQIELSVGLRHGGVLYAAAQQSSFWYDKARMFKHMIIEKYQRMTLNNARKTYKDFNHFVPLDDCIQIFLQVLSRAIDRCNPRQGVLTTFIQNWFKSARSEVAKLAKGQSDQSYEAMSEDHGDAAHIALGTTDPDRSTELQQVIAEAARTVDPSGSVRAALGIPEILPYADRQSLLMFVEDPYEPEHELAESVAG